MASRASIAETEDVEVNQRHQVAVEADGRDLQAAERRHQRTLRALADVDASRLIDDEAMKAWADNLGTDHELPVPQPG